jgi:hypothetical protein
MVKNQNRQRANGKEEWICHVKETNGIYGMDSPIKQLYLTFFERRWEVRNVTTLVGLRAFQPKAILSRTNTWTWMRKYMYGVARNM